MGCKRQRSEKQDVDLCTLLTKTRLRSTTVAQHKGPMLPIDPSLTREAPKKRVSSKPPRTPRPKASQAMVKARTSFLPLPRELRQHILLDALPRKWQAREASRLIDLLKISVKNVGEPRRGFVLADVAWLGRKWAHARYIDENGARSCSSEERSLKVWKRWVKRYKEKQRARRIGDIIVTRA